MMNSGEPEQLKQLHRRWLFRTGIVVIAVVALCRRCQILNVACGGTLRNLRDDEIQNKLFTAFVERARATRRR